MIALKTTALVALAALGLAGLSPVPTQVDVTDGWVRATPPGAPTAAAYITFNNRGPSPDRLLRASTPAARSLEVHSMSMAGGVMRMRKLEALPLPARTIVRLQPGSDHLMLVGLHRPLRPGDIVPVALRLEAGGELRLTLPVRAR